MAPDLKSFHLTGIQHEQTISVIEKAHKYREAQETEGGATDRQNAGDDGMVQDVWDLMGARGRLVNQRLQDSLEDKREHDKEPLTDEQVETVAVWIREKDGSDGVVPKSLQQKEADEHFHRYVHHHHIRKWGILGSKEGMNEEWWIPNPTVLPLDSPQYLCEMCRHIGLGVLLSQRGLPGNDLPRPTKIRLHGLERVLKEKQCAFCRLVSRKIRSDRVLDFENEEEMKHVDFQLNVIDSGLENALQLEVELRHDSHQYRGQQMIIQKFDLADTSPFQALHVSVDRATEEVLVAWMALCQYEHPEDTVYCVKQ